jgi:hypothetical protein
MLPKFKHFDLRIANCKNKEREQKFDTLYKLFSQNQIIDFLPVNFPFIKLAVGCGNPHGIIFSVKKIGMG